MSYCTPSDIIQLTGIKPDQINLEKGDDESLNSLLEGWIEQSESLINNYCDCSFDESDNEDALKAVKSVCMRLTANMVALAQARRDTGLIKVNDWNVQIVSSRIFTNDLKEDLKPFKRSLKGNVGFFVVAGD